VGIGAAAVWMLPVGLTRRGWSTLGVVGLAVGMAVLYGTRELQALVVPLVLAIVAAVVSVLFSSRPEHRRILPEHAHAGESRTVGLVFDVETPEVAILEDTVGDGLSAVGNRVEATIGDGRVEYELRYEERGVHRLGPLTVWVQDVLRLATRRFEYPDVDEVVVYPPVRPLAGATRQELNLLAGGVPEREREEFHRLREYTTGDSLRDVHWRTSAKQPHDELVVKEFVSEDRFGDVEIVAEGPESRADELAESVASIAVDLLDRGIEVGVTLPDGSVPVSIGSDHRARLLELLARTDGGELEDDDRVDAAVEVVAEPGGVTGRIGDYETSFATLAALAEERAGDGRTERTAAPVEREDREEVVA